MSESRRLVSKSVYTVFHWSHESYQGLINLRHNTPFSRKINPLAISVPHSMQSERDLSIWLWSSLVDVICGACQNNICAYVLFCVIHGMFLLLMLKNDVVVFLFQLKLRLYHARSVATNPPGFTMALLHVKGARWEFWCSTLFIIYFIFLP